MDKLETEMTVVDREVIRLQAQLKEIQEKHIFMCDYFGLEKNDEMREKSEEFFKVFQSFFKQMDASMPKIERKKTVVAKK